MVEFVLEHRWVLIPVGLAWVGLMFSIKVAIIGLMAKGDPAPDEPDGETEHVASSTPPVS